MTSLEFSTLRAVWNLRDDRTLSAAEVRVLNALIAHCNAQGHCYPTIRTLADVTRMHTETVTAALAQLETRPGPIVVKIKRAPVDEKGKPKRDAKGHIEGNEYRLVPGVGWSTYEKELQESQSSKSALGSQIPVAPVPRLPSAQYGSGKNPVRIWGTEEVTLKKKSKEVSAPPAEPLSFTFVPEDWKPKKRHRNYASTFTLDLAAEEAAFRAYYATGKHTWQGTVDGAFMGWLEGNYAKSAPPPGAVQHKVRKAREFDVAQAAESNPELAALLRTAVR